MTSQDVQWRRYQLDFHRSIGSFWVDGFGSSKGIFDSVYALVGKAGHFNVGADFGGLGGEALGDVGLEFAFDDFGWELHFGPDIGVSAGKGQHEARVWEDEVEYVIESLKASTAWPYFLFSGHPIS